jgi:hypothetical protein
MAACKESTESGVIRADPRQRAVIGYLDLAAAVQA